MRKLTVLFAACVVVLYGSVRAAESKDWFSGGIGSGWPNDASMFGGAWCAGAEERGRILADKATLQISSEEDEPLSFEATDPKPLGTDFAATNVTISFVCAFQPFSLQTLPAVPAEAKGAIILVTEEEEPDEAPGGEFYYAAYDQDSGMNVWKPSGIAATTNDLVDVVMLISHGDAGFVNVQYTIGNQLLEEVPFLLKSDPLVSDVVYVGSGRTGNLASKFKSVDPYRIGETEYADFASMNAELEDGDTVYVQLNDTLPAGATLSKNVTFVVIGSCVLSTLSGESLTNAADSVFTARGAANLPLSLFIRTDRTLTLPAGVPLGHVSGEDYAHVVIGGDAWVRYGGVWQMAGMVTMNFYYPGYFDFPEVTLSGLFGDRIVSRQFDSFANDVNTDEDVQDYYWNATTEILIDRNVYWFDGSWSDAAGHPVEFPTHYASGAFYPNSTAIWHRITYDMGGVKATHGNPTLYSIETYYQDLGAAIPDPDSEWVFNAWTDESGNEVTNINPIAIGASSNTLYDITLYAEWKPKAEATSMKMKTAAAIRPGEDAAHYDTSEQAQAAATSFNADRPDHVCAPSGFTGDTAAYAENFEAAANGTAISIMLTGEAAEKIAERLNSDTRVAAELANPETTTVTISNAEPGFYYSVVGGTTLDSVVTEGVRKLAQGTAVKLEKPDLGTTDKAFYKIRASVKDDL